MAVINDSDEPQTLPEGLVLVAFGKVTYKRIADDKLPDDATDCLASLACSRYRGENFGNRNRCLDLTYVSPSRALYPRAETLEFIRIHTAWVATYQQGPLAASTVNEWLCQDTVVSASTVG